MNSDLSGTLFMGCYSKSLFIISDLYCSSGTIAINLSHPFLIKRLREGEDRGTVTSAFPPKGRGYAPQYMLGAPYLQEVQYLVLCD
jgi:hypothetical protein